MGKIRIRDELPDHISENLETIFRLKYLILCCGCGFGSGNLFDPKSGMEKIRIRDEHPGSATLHIIIITLLGSNISPCVIRYGI
jgi:hypothetical protein